MPVVKGKHKGKIGYYDDDDPGEDDEPGDAIVYFGEPFESEYVLLKHADLEPTDVKSVHLERWKRRYPWLAKHFDVP